MPTVPGLASPFNFSLPDGDIDGKSFKITIPNIDAQAVRKDSFVVSQLFIKKPPQPEGDASHDAVDPPAVDPPAVAAHEPVTSQFGPPVPVSELYARLCVEPLPTASFGDCFPLAAMCTYELSPEQIAAPNATTTEAVRIARGGAVDIIAGTQAIGGISSSVVRAEEGMVKTPAAAERKMAPWRANAHWATAEAKHSAAFMFSLAAHLERTVIVLEKTPNDTIVDPARAYGMRVDGALRRTPPAPHKQETVPLYFTLALKDLPTVLRASACSLLQYDRAGVHHEPLVRDIAWTEADDEVAAHNAAAEAEDAVEAVAPMEPVEVSAEQEAAAIAQEGAAPMAADAPWNH